MAISGVKKRKIWIFIYLFIYCKEAVLHWKISSCLFDMFQLDPSKIKEARTDESLKGTGKVPV